MVVKSYYHHGEEVQVCSGIGRKRECGIKSKKAAVVDYPEEEEYVPPQAASHEPREYDPFFPSDVVDNLLLKAMEDCGEPTLADKERIRQQSVAYMFICTFCVESDKAKWSRKDGYIPAI